MFRHRNEYPVESSLPSFEGATAWLNGEPVTSGALRGHVVLVCFGTYTCINWIHALPYVRAWADTYAERGLAVVGVQTPEFAFEAELDNVERALAEMDVRYLVAVDNDAVVWHAFANHYWPALYIADAEGRIRHHRFGEGGYDESEMVIQMLLRDLDDDVDVPRVHVEPHGVEAAADWPNVRSPETYLGYERASGFASPGGSVAGAVMRYSSPGTLRRNEWALTGQWRIGPVPVLLTEPGGAITFEFHARDVHLVMGPPLGQSPVRFRVHIDGRAPGAAAGVDVDEDGNGAADYQRMYQLVRQPGAIDDRRFEIEFFDAGVEAFVFTFG